MRFLSALWPRGMVTLHRALAIFLFVVGAAQADVMRAVSANLCADQLLLALADPAQIISLSPFARDGSLSLLAGTAQRFPSNRGSAEELIDLKPDLVLIGSFDSRHARAMLERKTIPFVALDPWRDLGQGRRQIRDVSLRLGQAARGEALLARIDAGMARLEDFKRTRRKSATFLVLHRRGYAFHSGVIVELATAAGLRNASGPLGLQTSGAIALERIVIQPPDYLIVTQPPNAPTDQGEALLAHPALLKLFPAERRLVVPDNLSICAGPSTPALIERLADEIETKIK